MSFSQIISDAFDAPCVVSLCRNDVNWNDLIAKRYSGSDSISSLKYFDIKRFHQLRTTSLPPQQKTALKNQRRSKLGSLL
ncbi:MULTISPECIES: hypothetical protein [unclassified Sulfitobacter]|uniref:hypothetical protein n=1 Tax=unclassified Sulfitobacter TaxID=196795 RepID=UPI0023E2A36B|nr:MULTISPECIES: hypothetical protein [unclassified Sulfitobacter]MDF3416570.1 hypothetical protein [Sulfitobacter sp. KE5]MDF3424050.1 hypothetical protein [Sulfitobacter sp. KE43]MDF3476198.1 hypothetical protein [Sulfitobacter sp. M48]MDF3495740.1 hypothetical protein [Sulfitobacter sp. M51]MDF3499607.1 hypothetical protein [Sulfitobacter sp. M56]MDF3503512.1 hypothetical protein [Sulfitobacter sp. Ks17]MDF3519111.1 hypothetical protein [Sulfitobacter sp. M63]MDF3530808.1 hypothetical pr